MEVFRLSTSYRSLFSLDRENILRAACWIFAQRMTQALKAAVANFDPAGECEIHVPMTYMVAARLA